MSTPLNPPSIFFRTNLKNGIWKAISVNVLRARQKRLRVVFFLNKFIIFIS
jgi:hypothetical protein